MNQNLLTSRDKIGFHTHEKIIKMHSTIYTYIHNKKQNQIHKMSTNYKVFIQGQKRNTLITRFNLPQTFLEVN